MDVYAISGYFIDGSGLPDDSFNNCLVAEYDTVPEGYSDDDIFFYGLSEDKIIEAIHSGEPVDDFVITDYERMT